MSCFCWQAFQACCLHSAVALSLFTLVGFLFSFRRWSQDVDGNTMIWSRGCIVVVVAKLVLIIAVSKLAPLFCLLCLLLFFAFHFERNQPPCKFPIAWSLALPWPTPKLPDGRGSKSRSSSIIRSCGCFCWRCIDDDDDDGGKASTPAFWSQTMLLLSPRHSFLHVAFVYDQRELCL